MLTVQQLAFRKNYLGASDCPAVVLGKDAYGRTLHDVYLDKISPPPTEVKEPSYAMRVGNALEPLMVAEVGRQKGCDVIHCTDTMTNAVFPWLASTPDGLTASHVVEAKAHGFHRRFEYGETGDEVPFDVLIQVHAQMLVCGRRAAYVAATLGTEFRLFEVPFEQKLGDVIVEKTRDFWNHHVQARKAPALDGSVGATELLKALYPKSNSQVVTATEEQAKLVTEYLAVRAQFEETESALELSKQRLMATMGDVEVLSAPAGKVSWKSRGAYERPACVVQASRVFQVRKAK
jgi:predicted phage-related endonuclease